MKVHEILEAYVQKQPVYLWHAEGIPGEGRGSYSEGNWVENELWVRHEDGYDGDDDDDWDDFGHRWQYLSLIGTEDGAKAFARGFNNKEFSISKEERITDPLNQYPNVPTSVWKQLGMGGKHLNKKQHEELQGIIDKVVAGLKVIKNVKYDMKSIENQVDRDVDRTMEYRYEYPDEPHYSRFAKKGRGYIKQMLMKEKIRELECYRQRLGKLFTLFLSGDIDTLKDDEREAVPSCTSDYVYTNRQNIWQTTSEHQRYSYDLLPQRAASAVFDAVMELYKFDNGKKHSAIENFNPHDFNIPRNMR
jgi:hypothetical protein